VIAIGKAAKALTVYRFNAAAARHRSASTADVTGPVAKIT
jgi:hypothetical protein